MLQVIRAVSTKGGSRSTACRNRWHPAGKGSLGSRRACLCGGFHLGHGNSSAPASLQTAHDLMGGICPGNRTDAVADGFLQTGCIGRSFPEPDDTVRIEYDATSLAQTECNQAES